VDNKENEESSDDEMPPWNKIGRHNLAWE
jgi:hypothetical protein